jgi:hypothetical protein
VEADQVQVRARHQGGEALQDVDRRHFGMRRAVAPRGLDLEAHA